MRSDFEEYWLNRGQEHQTCYAERHQPDGDTSWAVILEVTDDDRADEAAEAKTDDLYVLIEQDTQGFVDATFIDAGRAAELRDEWEAVCDGDGDDFE